MSSYKVNVSEKQLAEIRLLIARLERLSADSYWAHRASGLRGSLLRCLETIEISGYQEQSTPEIEHLDALVKDGFEMLTNAAREIRVQELRK